MIIILFLFWSALYYWHCRQADKAFKGMTDCARRATAMAQETINENERLRAELNQRNREGEEWKETE